MASISAFTSPSVFLGLISSSRHVSSDFLLLYQTTEREAKRTSPCFPLLPPLLPRVRHHGNLARIEVPGEYLKFVVERAGEVNARLKEIGYTYISLDLQGYRTGAMNETLDRK